MTFNAASFIFDSSYPPDVSATCLGHLFVHPLHSSKSAEHHMWCLQRWRIVRFAMPSTMKVAPVAGERVCTIANVYDSTEEDLGIRRWTSCLMNAIQLSFFVVACPSPALRVAL